MSFETLKKDDLLRIAEEFGTDIKPTDTKAIIIAALNEDGVTWEQAAVFDQAVAERDEILKIGKMIAEEDAKAAEAKVLLKMNRANGSYEIRGYKFTRTHPYGIVAESDALWITDNIEGFRYATPREASEFYG
jgi:hypothetical protein